MRVVSISIWFLIFITSCNESIRKEDVDITKDTIVIIQRDTVVLIKNDTNRTGTFAPEQTNPVKQKEVVSKSNPAKENNDTTFHYYINKKVSVKVTPWHDGERWILLYDLYGLETYRHKDISKSYSVLARLSFHPNGAVSKMTISENPGASQYWHETTITFSTINEPEQKTSERKPYEELSALPKHWEYWDKKAKQWRKQEVQE